MRWSSDLGEFLMRHSWISIFLCFSFFVMLTSPALALAPYPPCDSETPCADGWTCQQNPCPLIACAESDPDCDTTCPDEGICEPNPKPECETDADCGAGLMCEKDEATTATCTEGSDCPPAATFARCIPAPCTKDSDCGDSLVCLSVEMPCENMATLIVGTTDGRNGKTTAPPEKNCDSNTACPDGWTCLQDPCLGQVGTDDGRDSGVTCPDEGICQQECKSETKQFCAPKWLAPCEVDADCGDGFNCKEAMQCSCKGGGGGSVPPTPVDPPTMPDDGPDGDGDDEKPATETESKGDDTDGDEEDCDCTPTGEKYCEPKEIKCDSNADCPTDWSCESLSSTTTSTICLEPANGEAECNEDDDPVIEETKQCLPKDAMKWMNALDGPGGTASELSYSQDNVNTEEPQTPEPSADSSGGSGCQTGGNSSGAGLASVLMLLGLFVMRRRLYIKG
jgi:MYXO-CTERM domain-containing protein